MHWQPAASLAIIRQRAELLSRLRRFFSDRGVLEVETPLLCSNGITDPSIEPFTVPCGEALTQPRFLQTSPEYAMKRLLAAHGEPIFQIARAFRDGEAGSRHNPEFSLLEWYRPGFDHHQLMDEVGQLLNDCLGARAVETFSYRQLFLQRLQVDPFTASSAELERIARRHIDPGSMVGDRDMWLELLMSHLLEPQLGDGTLSFVYDYPASQAALARVVSAGDVSVGQRFELYVDGVELANGYCELTDATQQRQRFERDNAVRCERGQLERPIDGYLLAAMDHGLPSCSGVALGIDRLLMLMTGAPCIQDVLAFDWQRS
ncbi:Elongation factor P--(R)-beta-lysine ligase [Halioglobus japonicus]|nr:Elongation factor P--(R)-beta-lysine ligase [Halioglobus japonicus]